MIERVLLYGDRIAGSGGWCYARAFERRGMAVQAFSDWEGLENYQLRSFRRIYRRLTSALLERDRQAHITRLHACIKRHRPELVVVLKGLHLGPQDICRIRDSGSVVVIVNHDDFFSQYPLNWSRLQRASLPSYDYILTTREINVEEIRPLNSRVAFFSFAYEPLIHRPVAIPDDESEIWHVDAVFVGTYARQRASLLENLVQKLPANYAIWGSGWHRLSGSSPLRRFVRFKSLAFEDQAKALGGAKISLGFLRKENRDDYTQRTFEIPACGGLLLAERTERHLRFYKEGREAEFFDPNRPGELVEKTRELLSNDRQREQIRLAGQAAVAQLGVTYDVRIEQLLSIGETLIAT